MRLWAKIGLPIVIATILVVFLFEKPILAKQGCCSHHSGICGCSGGRQLCCDGTLNPSCICYSPPAQAPVIPFVPTATPTSRPIPTKNPTPTRAFTPILTITPIATITSSQQPEVKGENMEVISMPTVSSVTAGTNTGNAVLGFVILASLAGGLLLLFKNIWKKIRIEKKR